MSLHNSFKISARTARKFIIEELGFDKENGYKNVKVIRFGNSSFDVRVFPILNNGLYDKYKSFYFLCWEDTFSFENFLEYEGVDINESKVYDEVWRTFVKKESKGKRPGIKLKKIN